MTFVLEAVRVNRGSALLLHFGPSGEVPRRILIDCGADGSYRDCLRPRLEQLGSPGNDLPLCMVLIGQMDSPHLGEAKALFDDIESGQSPLRPEAIWLNVTSGEQDDPARRIREKAVQLAFVLTRHPSQEYKKFADQFNIHRTRINFSNNGMDNFYDMAKKGILK